jgi:hypothetical protein
LEKDIQALMHNLEVIENKIDFYEERLQVKNEGFSSQLEAEKEKSTN